jgi:hypothetical protein
MNLELSMEPHQLHPKRHWKNPIALQKPTLPQSTIIADQITFFILLVPPPKDENVETKG